MPPAREMQYALAGKTIRQIEVVRPKCLNAPPEDFVGARPDATKKMGVASQLACDVPFVGHKARRYEKMSEVLWGLPLDLWM